MNTYETTERELIYGEAQTAILKDLTRRAQGQAAALRALAEKPKQMMICPAKQDGRCKPVKLNEHCTPHPFERGCTVFCHEVAAPKSSAGPCIPVPAPEPAPAPVREIDRQELQRSIRTAWDAINGTQYVGKHGLLLPLEVQYSILAVLRNCAALADGKARIKGAAIYCYPTNGECNIGDYDCSECPEFAEATSEQARNQGNWTENK